MTSAPGARGCYRRARTDTHNLQCAIIYNASTHATHAAAAGNAPQAHDRNRQRRRHTTRLIDVTVHTHRMQAYNMHRRMQHSPHNMQRRMQRAIMPDAAQRRSRSLARQTSTTDRSTRRWRTSKVTTESTAPRLDAAATSSLPSQHSTICRHTAHELVSASVRAPEQAFASRVSTHRTLTTLQYEEYLCAQLIAAVRAVRLQARCCCAAARAGRRAGGRRARHGGPRGL